MNIVWSQLVSCGSVTTGGDDRFWLREILARYHWLGGRIADYQGEPAVAVIELRACLLLCQGQVEASRDARPHREGCLSGTTARGEVHLTLGGCQTDGEVSSRAAAAKLEALEVYSASAQGTERIAVRHPAKRIALSPSTMTCH